MLYLEQGADPDKKSSWVAVDDSRFRDIGLNVGLPEKAAVVASDDEAVAMLPPEAQMVDTIWITQDDRARLFRRPAQIWQGVVPTTGSNTWVYRLDGRYYYLFLVGRDPADPAGWSTDPVTYAAHASWAGEPTETPTPGQRLSAEATARFGNLPKKRHPERRAAWIEGYRKLAAEMGVEPLPLE